jgi:hypothetical protein
MDFDSADALITYLPASGAANALAADLLDPNPSNPNLPPGTLGGEVATLKLNIDFSAAGLLAHPAGVPVRQSYIDGTHWIVFVAERFDRERSPDSREFGFGRCFFGF